MAPPPPEEVEVPAADAVTVYWRPGCMFCSSLLRGLERLGLPLERHDIWSEPDAAADLRRITGGPETVPTVTVGAVALVNPAVRDVLRAVEQERPDALPEGVEVPPRRWWERLLP